ncbi:MAG: hypothetical protein AAGA78_04560 [Pseudomonadota bacterium]
MSACDQPKEGYQQYGLCQRPEAEAIKGYQLGMIRQSRACAEWTERLGTVSFDVAGGQADLRSV